MHLLLACFRSYPVLSDIFLFYRYYKEIMTESGLVESSASPCDFAASLRRDLLFLVLDHQWHEFPVESTFSFSSLSE